jgi:hypothetical protein
MGANIVPFEYTFDSDLTINGSLVPAGSYLVKAPAARIKDVTLFNQSLATISLAMPSAPASISTVFATEKAIVVTGKPGLKAQLDEVFATPPSAERWKDAVDFDPKKVEIYASVGGPCNSYGSGTVSLSAGNVVKATSAALKALEAKLAKNINALAPVVVAIFRILGRRCSLFIIPLLPMLSL